jgi:hypothetical protein
MLSWMLAEFIEGVHYEDLPPETIRLVRLALLDWLGSALRGGREKPAVIALRVLGAQGGSPQATLLPAGEKTSALNVALGNGIASHILELDDVHRGSIVHAGAAVMPAALATAEMLHANGRKLIESIVVGYEVAIRIDEACLPRTMATGIIPEPAAPSGPAPPWANFSASTRSRWFGPWGMRIPRPPGFGNSAGRRDVQALASWQGGPKWTSGSFAR